MPDYFLIHDAEHFDQHLRPAVALSWQRRTFEPCRCFCRGLESRVDEFAERYHLGPGESLIRLVAEGLPFDRDFWRALVGELLLYTAVDIPEFPTCLDTLSALVEADRLASVRQAHLGSQDLTFGAAIYRPDACGFNDASAVRRLASELADIDPALWLSEKLTHIDAADRDEELEFARDWFPSLRDMYQRAAAENRVIVREFV